MKIALDKDVRIKRDENYEVLRSIENKIAERIRAEFADEVAALRKENDNLHNEDKAFREEAYKLLRTLTPEIPLKVRTQVGKGSTVIHEYTGHIERKIDHAQTHFNFISPDKYEGKPFTIGLSCLLSIEVIDRKSRIENLQ